MASGGLEYTGVNFQGYAVFVVNIEPNGDTGNFEFQHREGAREESGNLRTLFCDGLGFKWMNSERYWHQNLTVDRWDHRKKKAQATEQRQDCCLCCRIQSIDHSQSKCFVLAISSHGREITETEVIFSDGQSIYLTEIFDALNDHNCPTLKGIPRIIILQACRSNFENKELVTTMQDRGVPLQVEMTARQTKGAPSTNTREDTERAQLPEIDYTFQQLALAKMPTNFLLVYPAVSGQRAQCNTTDGSWLIYSLKKMYEEYYFQKPVNILHLLTHAAGYIAREKETIAFQHEEGTNKVMKDEDGNPIKDKENSGIKNAVCFHHRLINPLILHPKARDITIEDIPDLPSLYFGKKKKKNMKVDKI